MHELVLIGGGHGWLALAAVAVAWAGALARIAAPGRDYRAAAAGGWLLLGGIIMVCLSAATLVPLHAPVLVTIYAGIGPALVVVLGMAGLVVVDGMADWLNPPNPRPGRAARWGSMPLILAGIGLLMEVRSALAVHMGVVGDPSGQLVEATERWFHLARSGGGATALIGLMMVVDGLAGALRRPPAPAPAPAPAAQDQRTSPGIQSR